MPGRHAPRPVRATPGGRCRLDGFPIEIVIHSTRRTELRCPRCERRRAGLCLDCDRRVTGRSWRCERHRLAAMRAHYRRYKARHVTKAEHAENMRAWYATHRMEEVARSRRWRARHPEKVRQDNARRRLERRHRQSVAA